MQQMGGRAAIRTALAMLVLTASAACTASAADKAGPTATVATEPPRTTTTNPYAVPAVIDIAYVNRVLAGLDAAIGDVTRLVVRTRTIPPEAFERLKAIYGDPRLLQLAIDSFQNDVRKGFSNYRPNPGNESTSVQQLIATRPNCIFARVARDYTAVGTKVSSEAGVEWIGLKPLTSSASDAAYNPTSWTLIYEGFPPNRIQPPDPCTD